MNGSSIGLKQSVMLRFIILFTLLILVMFVSLVSGVAQTTITQVWRAVVEQDPGQDTLRLILFDVRLPRILLGALTGACLATTGAAIQGLFRNPLADPALIGVSSGAALVAAASIVFGTLLHESLDVWWLVPFAAFLGGLAATQLVVWLGTGSGGTSVPMMLLAGIAINAIAIAGVGSISYLSSAIELRTITFWSLGSFANTDWRGVGLASSLLLVIVLLSREYRGLDAIVLGESEARHLGIRVESLKRRVILLTALGIGVAVSLSGIIAFIGLVVPHLVRLSIGSGHRLLLPASALLGALLVVLADLLARLVVAPAELPVGIVTSLIGGPFFIYLIHRQKHQVSYQ